MKCPQRTRDLLQQLATVWDEGFDPDDGPAVVVDSYSCVWWDEALDRIGYAPAMDPIAGDSLTPCGDLFFITEDELRRMVDEQGWVPPLTRPW